MGKIKTFKKFAKVEILSFRKKCSFSFASHHIDSGIHVHVYRIVIQNFN